MIEIEVTEGHIREGKQEDCDFCPIALSIKERYPEAKKIEVFPALIYIDYCDHLEIYKLSEYDKQWICNFDNDRASVEPFTLTLGNSITYR